MCSVFIHHFYLMRNNKDFLKIEYIFLFGGDYNDSFIFIIIMLLFFSSFIIFLRHLFLFSYLMILVIIYFLFKTINFKMMDLYIK